jgi:hypothetical protein
MRKGYKETSDGTAMRRGQIALFIILALVIIGVFLFYLVYPQLPINSSGRDNPSSFLQGCILPSLEQDLVSLSAQGGELTSTHYRLYKGTKYNYLCYTDESYKPCVVQQPLLVPHAESVLKKSLELKARECLAQLKADFESKGYRVSGSNAQLNVSITPHKVIVSFLAPFEISKETTQTFRTFYFEKKTELYDLLLISTSIINFESTLGDSETTLYTQYYPDLIIEKTKTEGDTLYTVSNVVTKDSFSFATRSLVWPVGYGGVA